MSPPIDVIAIIKPKPGKADRVNEYATLFTPQNTDSKQVVELLQIAAEGVKEKEQGTLRYQINLETKGDAPAVVMLETCVNLVYCSLKILMEGICADTKTRLRYRRMARAIITIR
jgi:hypothetical protein